MRLDAEALSVGRDLRLARVQLAGLAVLEEAALHGESGAPFCILSCEKYPLESFVVVAAISSFSESLTVAVRSPPTSAHVGVAAPSLASMMMSRAFTWCSMVRTPLA
ncbi:hypothetical protein [Nocardiopsis dassonvillei]|uniref:hypothetical protein n=1 Tax=Nocardiopsis dassonvillei TaxID=2014 RepID=UPI0036734A5C